MLRLSRVILIVGVILVLLGTALIVVPGYVDWTRYRSIVETAVGDAIGRRVSIDGEIALTVLPKPAFEIGEVTVFPTTEIAPPGAGAPLGEGAPPAGEGAPLKVGLMTATIEPRPLFQGDFHITSLVLAQTELNLGARNPVDFLNTKSDGPVTFDPGVLLTGWASRVGGFFSNVRIDELGLEDASITWLREEANGGQETLRVERASARLLSATGPFEARGSILFRDRAYDADLNVASFANRAEIPFDFEILARDTKLLAALRGTAAGMESETPVLTGTVEFAGPSVSLLLPAFGDGAAIGPQDAEPAGQTRDEAGKSVPFRIIGPVRYRDGQIKAEALTWSQGPDSLTVGLDADLKDRSILRLDVTADDPLRLGPAALPAFERFVARPGPLLRAFKKADLDFVLPSASIGPWQSDRFHGALYFEEGRVSLMDFDAEGGAFGRARLRGQPKQGTDSLVTTATFNADFADPRQAMSELGADLDRVAEGLYESLSVAASLTISSDLIRIETFRINLDENSYQGAMALRRSQRTSLGLSLSGQRFDFDGYGLAGPVRSLLQGGTGDVSLKVAAGAVRLQGITLAGLGLNARRVNGLVTLEAFEAETDLFGTLTAAGTVSLADPSAPLDLKGSWAGSPCSVQRLSETSSRPEGGGESEGGPTVFCRLLETATTQFALTGTGDAATAALTLGAPEQDPATLTVGAFDIFDVQGGRSVPVSGSGRTDAL
ncbi:MAG: AsmA family protein, partial [Pseudomonadota bacterium]